MSINQLGALRRKRDRFLRMPIGGKILEEAIATGFIKGNWDLRYAITRKVTKKTMVVEFVLAEVERSKREPMDILKKVFVLEFPYDPDLWIDTTSD